MRKLFNSFGRILFIIARPLLILYFYLNPSPRVRVIVMDKRENLVLLKGWFSSQQWELPGGGIEKGETPAMAARRELKEETGLDIELSNIEPLGTATHKNGMLSYKVTLFYCPVDSIDPVTIKTDRWWEITDVSLFPVHRLPDRTGPLVRRALLRASEMNG